MTDMQEFIDRYLAVWHEPDATRRRHAVEQIWTDDAEHYTPTIEARGYEQLTTRVAGAYDKWVAPGQYCFRAGSAVDSHHDAATFVWEMVDVDGGAVAAAGRDFFLFADDGRVRLHYQFNVLSAPAR